MKHFLAAVLVTFSVSSLALGQGEAGTKELLPGDEGYPTKQLPPLQMGNAGNNNALFLNAGLGFGQARSTEPDSSAGLTFLGNFEVGYQMNRGDWNRFKASLQLFSGQASFRNPSYLSGKTDIPIKLGVLARLGYGYSIGNKFYGLLKVGVGPVLADFEGNPEGVKIKSEGTMSGLATQIGWLAVMPMAASLDLTGGVTWTHMQFDVGKVKIDGGAAQDFDRNVLINIPQVELGLRLRI